MAINNPNTYLTQTEAAEILRISERTLERMRLTGDGPLFMKAGARRVIYSASDIESWLTERTYKSTSEASNNMVKSG